MNHRRHFSKKEREALFLAADGTERTQWPPLSDDWHADHIVPHALGGVTDVTNGQALTAQENLSKGKKMSNFIPRLWQGRVCDGIREP